MKLSLSLFMRGIRTQCQIVCASNIIRSSPTFFRTSHTNVYKYNHFQRTVTSLPRSVSNAGTSVPLVCTPIKLSSAAPYFTRNYTSSAPHQPSTSEEKLVQRLRQHLPKATTVEVNDISGKIFLKAIFLE